MDGVDHCPKHRIPGDYFLQARKAKEFPPKLDQSRPGSCKHHQRTGLPSQPASGGEPRTNWIIVHRYNRPPTKPQREKKIPTSKEVTATLDGDATANTPGQTEMKEIQGALKRKSIGVIVWMVPDQTLGYVADKDTEVSFFFLFP